MSFASSCAAKVCIICLTTKFSSLFYLRRLPTALRRRKRCGWKSRSLPLRRKPRESHLILGASRKSGGYLQPSVARRGLAPLIYYPPFALNAFCCGTSLYSVPCTSRVRHPSRALTTLSRSRSGVPRTRERAGVCIYEESPDSRNVNRGFL